MTKNDEKPVVNFYRAEKKPAPSSTADSDLQGKLDSVTAERDELQRFSDEAQRIFTPVAGDGGKDESGLEAMQRIVNERNSLRFETKRLQDIIDVGKPANESLIKERAALELKVADLTKERDSLKAQLGGIKTEYDDYVKASDETGKQLQAERDAAQKALADGKVIPADALKRITDVKGVGEKLAPEILAALTGK